MVGDAHRVPDRRLGGTRRQRLIFIRCASPIDEDVSAKTLALVVRSTVLVRISEAAPRGLVQCSNHDVSLVHVDYNSALYSNGAGEPYRVPDCLDCLDCLPVVLEEEVPTTPRHAQLCAPGGCNLARPI